MKIGEYELKAQMNIGEMRKAKTFAKDLVGFQEKLEKATPDEQEKMAMEAMNRSEEQDGYLFSVLNRCLGVSKEQFESMTYPEAGVLFDQLLGASVPTKKSSQPYA